METDSAQMSASAAWAKRARGLGSEHEHGSVLVQAMFANLSSLALSSSLSIGQNATQDRQHILYSQSSVARGSRPAIPSTRWSPCS